MKPKLFDIKNICSKSFYLIQPMSYLTQWFLMCTRWTTTLYNCTNIAFATIVFDQLYEPTAKKTKLRNCTEDFIMLGFISVDSKPICLECDAILTNASTKKSKLEQHQKSKHPSSVGVIFLSFWEQFIY